MKFFMAYSRADKDYAASLAAEIERKGGSVCYDKSAWGPGAEWRGELRELLNNSGAAILVLPREGASGANNAILGGPAPPRRWEKRCSSSRVVGQTANFLPASRISRYSTPKTSRIQEIAGALVQYAA